MKFLIFVALASTAAAVPHNHPAHLSKDQTAKVQEYSIDCIGKTGVGLDKLADAKKGKFADDEALKKFTLCFFEKTGILTKDGQLNEEVALSKLPANVDKAAVKKVLEECKMKKGKDVSDTAFEIYKCYYKATPTHVAL